MSWSRLSLNIRLGRSLVREKPSGVFENKFVNIGHLMPPRPTFAWEAPKGPFVGGPGKSELRLLKRNYFLVQATPVNGTTSKANERETKSCLDRVFKYKLVFLQWVQLHGIDKSKHRYSWIPGPGSVCSFSSFYSMVLRKLKKAEIRTASEP